MYNYNYNNKEEIDDINIHDAYFSGFSYIYDKREILLECNNFENTNVFHFKFCKVVFAKMQCCNFWGDGDRIMYISTQNMDSQDTTNYIEELEKCKFENHPSYIDNKDKLITIEILLNSGDIFIIICENIMFEKSEIQV